MFGNNGLGDYYNASLKADKAQKKIDRINAVIPKTKLFSLIEVAVAIIIIVIINMTTDRAKSDNYTSLLCLVGFGFFVLNTAMFYSKCGGFLSGIKFFFVGAYYGWLLIPIFPLDIAAALFIGFLGQIVFVFCPTLLLVLVRASEISKLNEANYCMDAIDNAEQVLADMDDEVCYCPNCGNPIKEGASFCAKCGTNVVEEV